MITKTYPIEGHITVALIILGLLIISVVTA